MNQHGIEIAAQRYHDRVASLLISDELSQAEVDDLSERAYEAQQGKLEATPELFDELVVEELINDVEFGPLLRAAWAESGKHRIGGKTGDACEIGTRLIRLVELAVDSICTRAAEGEE